MANAQDNNSLEREDFERMIAAAKTNRKKADIALEAGLVFLKRHSIYSNYELLTLSATFFTAASEYAVLAKYRRSWLLSQVYLGRIDVVESRHEKAFEHLIALEPQVLESNDPQILAVWSFTIALLYYYLRAYSKSISHMQVALEKFSALGFQHDILICQFNLGVYLTEIGSLRQAFEAFKTALELALQQNSVFLEYCYVQVAKLCLRNNNDRESCMLYIERALEIYREKGDDNGELFALSVIAEYYLSIGDVDAALQMLGRCLDLQSKHSESNTFFLRVYAETLFRKQRFAEALELFEHIMALSRLRNDVALIFYTQRYLAAILFELKQYDSASELLEDCLDHYNIEDDDEDDDDDDDAAESKAECYRLLSKVREAQHRESEALEYYKYYHEWDRKQALRAAHYENENAKHRLDIEIAAREREELQRKAAELQRVLDSKRAELTSMAMALSQKNQLIVKLRSHIQSLESATSKGTQEEYRELVHDFESVKESGEQSWLRFQQQFESMHPGFSQQLQERYLDLSPIELRICLLLKLGLSTKDIANVLCVSRRTVETHRYQIRKKLELSKEENLVTVLMRL